jgi:hypothetical protein
MAQDLCKRSPYQLGRSLGRLDMLPFVTMGVAGAVALAEPKQAQKALEWGSLLSLVAFGASALLASRMKKQYADCSPLHEGSLWTSGIGSVPLPQGYQNYLPAQW